MCMSNPFLFHTLEWNDLSPFNEHPGRTRYCWLLNPKGSYFWWSHKGKLECATLYTVHVHVDPWDMCSSVRMPPPPPLPTIWCPPTFPTPHQWISALIHWWGVEKVGGGGHLPQMPPHADTTVHISWINMYMYNVAHYVALLPESTSIMWWLMSIHWDPG